MAQDSNLHLITCPRLTDSAKQEFVDLKMLERCNADYGCEVCGQIGNTLLYFDLPWSRYPLAYLVLHQSLKTLGLIWLLFTPIIGGTLLALPLFGSNPPVSSSWFWTILLTNLYWLYYFLKREQPKEKVNPKVNKRSLSVQNSLSLGTQAILYNALLIGQAGKKSVGLGDLLLSLLPNQKVSLILSRLGLDPLEIKKRTLELLKTETLSKDLRDFSPSSRASIFLSFEEATHLNERYIEPEDLFLASLKVPGIPQIIFKEKGITFEQAENCALWVVESLEKASLKTFLSGFLSTTGGLNRDWTGTITPELDSAGIDFTKLAQKALLPEIVGRSGEKEKIADILSQSSKNNVLLIGPAGAGKTSIVQGLAQDIVLGSSYRTIRYKRIISLDVGSLVAGATNQGSLEEKVQNILKDVSFGNIILFLDDLQTLAATKIGESDVSILSLLEKPLSFGRLQVIGAITREDYHKYIEKESSISRLFQMIEVEEASPEDALKITLSFVSHLERRYKVFITYQAAQSSIKLSNQYIHYKVLPDKALDVLEQTALAASKIGKKMVTPAEVGEVVSVLSKIPVSAVSESESEKLLNLEKRLHQRVVSQEEAITAVSNALRRARTGLKPANRPIAAFLFLGPTGVGKTELAKALAQAYFGSEKNMVRLDMAEYENESSIFQLIGAPPGQKGYEAGGQLTEAVKNQPFSIVLLDEIEKANSNIINAFLSVLDDGRLTDNSGTVIDFTNTIIIATSNACSELIQDRVANNIPLEKIKEEIVKSLNKFFKPEFLNRFDGTIIFKPLSTQELLEITKLLLNGVVLRLKEQGIEFKYGLNLVEQLAKLGFDPTLGARPLRRVIADKVENYLADQILRDKIKKGDTIDLESLP